MGSNNSTSVYRGHIVSRRILYVLHGCYVFWACCSGEDYPYIPGDCPIVDGNDYGHGILFRSRGNAMLGTVDVPDDLLLSERAVKRIFEV
jgi:hypothetical protein